MSSAFGLTPAGFVPKQLQDVVTEINAALQGTFGGNVNLGAESVFGQLVGIFAEREALLWQLAEAVYASQFPAGAEGTGVDNILALSNLKRLAASATVTNPAPDVLPSGITLYGLVLYGTAGTVVPAGSLIKSTTTPQYTFRLDNAVTIAAAANGQQSVVLSNTPTQGSFQLNVTNPATGQVLPTYAIAYNALPTAAQIAWAAAPTSGSWALMLGPFLTATLPYNVTAAALQSAIQAADPAQSLAGVTVTGSAGSAFAVQFASGLNHTVSLYNTTLTFASAPTAGAYQLAVNGVSAASLNYSATAAQVQAALVAIGWTRARVTVSPSSSLQMAINWIGSASVPTVTVVNNQTGVTLTVGSTYQLSSAATCAQSFQAAINALFDPVSLLRPFTDALATQSGNTYQLTFGAGTPMAGMPSSAATPIPLMTLLANSLGQAAAATNVAILLGASGSPAQGVGTATCAALGPNAVIAGQLSVIGTPTAGWSGVTNQLDCLAGSNTETDTAALVRRSQLLGSNANGPLPSIVDKVLQVPGVTAAIGFQNTTDAALQTIMFGSPPSTGSYSLGLVGGVTTLLPYSATSVVVQQALQAASGYSQVQVSGSPVFGFIVDWAGSYGGQAQPLMTVQQNTTGVAITAAFGRSPKSFEIVVQGGTNQAVAQAIYQTAPAGVASYATPAAQTTGTFAQGSNVVTVASSTNIATGQAVFGLGMPLGAMVVSVSGTQVTISQAALTGYTSTPLTFSAAAWLTDSQGNPLIVGFSRPQIAPFYVQLALTTDQYRTPGNPASGVNLLSRFSPSSIATIQQDIVAIGNQTPIGGTVVGYGSGGLMGAFNQVPGIVGYSLSFGPTPSPTNNSNVQLLPTQQASFQSFNVAVSYV